MKSILGSLIIVLAAGLNSFACAPPRDLIDVQPSEYTVVIRSGNVLSQLRSLGSKDIQSIVYDNGQYILNASNGCFVRASVIYSAVNTPGMCPGIVGVKVLEAKCH